VKEVAPATRDRISWLTKGCLRHWLEANQTGVLGGRADVVVRGRARQRKAVAAVRVHFRSWAGSVRDVQDAWTRKSEQVKRPGSFTESKILDRRVARSSELLDARHAV
jgi:hypothetical protein